MATETFLFEGTAGTPHYLALWNRSGQVFDFSDNTFKSLGSATTPYVAATERVNMGGSSKSGYTAAVNFANVNATAARMRLSASWYTNTALSAIVSDPLDVVVRLGQLDSGEGVSGFAPQIGACFTSSAGTEVRFSAWLERDGQLVVLTAGTCAIAIREHGSGVDLFSVSDAAPNAAGIFEATQASPGFTSDRLYLATVTIVSGGETFVGVHELPVFG